MFVLSLLATIVTPVAGEVRSYIRSDMDGSYAERITIYDRAPGEVWVHKARTRCTRSAFVTGKLDPETGQAILLTGGNLGRDLTQQPFAWLSREEDGVVRIRLGSAEAEPVLATETAERWVLFDFDLADIIAHPPEEIALRENFAFDLPLLLVGGEQPSLENLGQLMLSFLGEELHHGRQSLRYRATGSPIEGSEGHFWFGLDGRLLEATMPIPNHSEHKDFRLRLVDTGLGESAWREITAAHWEGCEPGE